MIRIGKTAGKIEFVVGKLEGKKWNEMCKFTNNEKSWSSGWN